MSAVVVVAVAGASSVACGLLIGIDPYHDCAGAECGDAGSEAGDGGTSDATPNGCLDDAGFSACPASKPVCSEGSCVTILSLAQGSSAFHSCAVLADGRARCWGSNSRGELGPKATDGRFPVDVGLTNIVEMGVGDITTCARLQSGEVDCWGDDKAGELGDGQKAPNGMSAAPVKVMASGATKIAVGAGACAATSDGGVVCWGANVVGELGCPSGVDHLAQPIPYFVPTPLTPDLGAPVTTMSLGAAMGCFGTAATDAGPAFTRCYGSGDFGLGDGRNAESPFYCDSSHDNGGLAEVLLDQSLPLGNAGVLATGETFACAVSLDANSRIFCWGDDTHGQVDGIPDSGPLLYGALMPTGSGVQPHGNLVTAGDAFTCARVVLDDGGTGVQCWGFANQFRLQGGGPVETIHELTDDVRDLASHRGFTCALQNNGDVRCWGKGSVPIGITTYQLLGTGDGSDAFTPTLVKW